jgi:two-component system sensor histidine kinase VanS
LRNNSKGFKRVLFITIILSLSIIWMVDRGFHGAIKEWFTSIFYLNPGYQEQGRIGVIFKSWEEIKLFFIYAFIIFIITIVFFMYVSYLYARRINKKEIAYIAEVMNSFTAANTDDLTLSKEYSEIETQLIKIKSVAQEHQHLMQMEMQRKSDLITYLAHDLKTPLASVIGYLSLLNEVTDMPPEQKSKYTGIALDKAYRLEELISEFFEITRFNLQSIVLNKNKIKLAFMLQQLADEFYPMLMPPGKQVAVDAPDGLILVGDADKLARVFNNILKNAVSYSYENSIISIKAAQQSDDVIITFTNQGDPIPSHKLETIFEKFYRLDSARSTDTGGAGLGLAIAQEIVTAHGGTILVESSLENTTFTVKLPML